MNRYLSRLILILFMIGPALHDSHVSSGAPISHAQGVFLVADLNDLTLLLHTDLNESLLFTIRDPSALHKEIVLQSDGRTTQTLPFQTAYGSPLQVISGTLFYMGGYDPVLGIELWRSDGTAEGTKIVKDIAPGEASSNPSVPLHFNDKLVFSIDHPPALWQRARTRENGWDRCGHGPGQRYPRRSGAQ